MAALLALLALAMTLLGAAAVVFGAEIIQAERGWTMVISGTVAATGGLVLLGVALIASRLGRLADALASAAPPRPAARQEESDTVSETPPVASPPPVAPPMAAPPPPPGVDALSDPPPLREPAVVGRYASGGSSYVMYEDGSVVADTPTGQRRYASLEELRSSVAASG